MRSELATPTATRAILDQFGHTAKHRLGQNFLVSNAVIEHIGRLASVSAADTVLEIGPGMGTLTCALLAEGATVVAVEADRELAPVLAQTCARDSERLALILGDALKVTPGELSAALQKIGAASTVPTKLISNLPYQVAATVVMRAFQQIDTLESATVMVQAEVADRMAATPGTKAYGGYTAKLALWAEPAGRFEVGPHNFMPAPHVNSAVIHLVRRAAQDPVDGHILTSSEIAAVSQVIDAAFAQRRKTIRNSLKASGYAPEAIDAALATCSIAPTTRAETLSWQTFVALQHSLSAHASEV